ncbi:MAG: hypothetical protein J6W73_02940 [Verrucomicrobia bacterium]|nr:hypothetical protein [Verrucomicrobiota bacterium]MBO7392471.1 hypothetical protein [Verrucomicrobiota bacterium]MBO7524026.1 hypothetical protein [Verrucomicrobiota bacterium]
MRLKVFLLTLFLSAAQAVMGQVSVSVTLDQDIYLSGESVIATVEITNLTGQSLKLGTQPNWLEFHIESKSATKPYINRVGDMDMSGEFTLGASMSAKRNIDILPYFELLKSGLYNLNATIHIDGWESDFSSPAVSFNVFNGVEVLTFDVGVPPKENEPPTLTPEIRRYAIIRVAYLNKMRLYTRITDQSGQTYFKVIPVCGTVAFSDPKAIVDTKSNLHILNQIHAKRFIYFVMDTDGVMLKREFYDYIGSKPVLYKHADGSVSVRNGVRIRTSADYPPSPAPVQPPSIVTKPGDSITNAIPDLKTMTKEEKKRYKEEQKRIKDEKRRLEKEEKKRKKAEEKM